MNCMMLSFDVRLNGKGVHVCCLLLLTYKFYLLKKKFVLPHYSQVFLPNYITIRDR